MSTTHAPIPTAKTASDAPVAAECPSCGASVRNISAQPGETIRCLNCGARFMPVPAGVQNPAAPGAEAPAPFEREPQSAGYWLIRIPGMIVAAASGFAFLGLLIATVGDLTSSNRITRSVYDNILPICTLPLFPLAGYFVFAITRSLARVEAGTIKAAWRAGCLRNPLPSTQGSSLPYILPLAVGPSLIVLVLLVSEFVHVAKPDPLLILAPLIEFPVFFLLALMCDNLRQFFWRQQALADACAANSGVDPGHSPDRRFPLLAFLFALMAVAGSSLTFSLLILEHDTRARMGWSHNYDEYKAVALLGLTILTFGITLFLLARGFQRATDAWWRTAYSAGAPPGVREKGRAAEWAIGAPFYLYCAAILFMIAKLIAEEDGPTTKMEVCAASLGAVLGALACFALPRLYLDARSWRRAQTEFWIARKAIDGQPRLAWWAAGTIYAAVAFSLLTAAMFLLSEWPSAPRMAVNHFIVEVPMTAVLIFLPEILFALIAREFMLADRLAVELQKREL